MLGPVVFRPLADSAGVSAVRSAFVVLDLRERMPVSRPSPASQASVREPAFPPLPAAPLPAAPVDVAVAVAVADGPPPPAAGEESQDEELVSGDDDEDLPAPRLTAVGATADPVKDYLKQIGRVRLLDAGQEVELAKRIEVGLFADRKLAEGSRGLSAGARIDLEEVAADGKLARNHLLEANLRLVVSLARLYTG